MVQKGLLAESWSVAVDDFIIDLAWSPDASKLAAVTVEGAVFLIRDQGASADVRLIGRHAGGGNSLSWRRDGAEFATAGHDGLAKVWDGDSGQELGALAAGNAWVSKTVYSPRRNVLATAAGKHLKLWDENREPFYESSDHPSTITDVHWHPRGPGIAAAANNGFVLHLSDTTAEPRTFSGIGSSLVLKWSPDARFIATGEQDATVHLWYLESGMHAQVRGFPTKVLELSWDSSGQWLATGSGPSLLLCDCSGEGPAGRQPRQYEGHSNKLTQIVFQPDGGLLATSDADAFLLLWDPIKHDKVIGGVLLSWPASCLRWCKADRLAAGQEDGRIVVFDVKSVINGSA